MTRCSERLLWDVSPTQISGHNGAKKIVAELESRGVHLAFLLDEGSFIYEGVVTGIEKPVAL